MNDEYKYGPEWEGWSDNSWNDYEDDYLDGDDYEDEDDGQPDSYTEWRLPDREVWLCKGRVGQDQRAGGTRQEHGATRRLDVEESRQRSEQAIDGLLGQGPGRRPVAL